MSYAGLALVFLLGAAVTAAVISRLVLLPRRWWWATAIVAVVLVALTAVFDSVMILADLFRYDVASLTGVRVWLTPVEDFAWPLAAVLVLPALWELLLRAGGTMSRRGEHLDAYCQHHRRRRAASAGGLVATAELGQHRVSVRCGLPARGWRAGRGLLVRSRVFPGALQPADVRRQRRLRLRVRPAQSSQGRRGGRRAAGPVAPADRMGLGALERPVPRSPRARRVLGLDSRASPGGLRGGRLFGTRPPLQRAATGRLDDLEHALHRPGGLRLPAGGFGAHGLGGDHLRRLLHVGHGLARLRRGAGHQGR